MPRGVHIQALSSDHKLQFNVFIPNVENGVEINYTTGHGSLPAGSNFWNSPSLANAVTGGGHMFTKLWLLLHILAIMGLIGSVMVQAKADASDKEDWFTRGRTIGKYFYMAIIGFDVVIAFALALWQLKFSTVLTLLIAIALFAGHQFVFPMMLADGLNELFIGSLLSDPRKLQQGEQEIRLLRYSIYFGIVGVGSIIVLITLF